MQAFALLFAALASTSTALILLFTDVGCNVGPVGSIGESESSDGCVNLQDTYESVSTTYDGPPPELILYSGRDCQSEGYNITTSGEVGTIFACTTASVGGWGSYKITVD